MADPVISGLSAYGGKYQKELIGQIFVELRKQRITILEGIKGKTYMPKLTVSGGIKPYTGTHAPTDKWNFSDRAVDPQLFQYDGYIEPLKYRTTFMTEDLNKSAADKNIPFEAFCWKKTIEAIAHEIVTKAIHSGIQGGVNPDPAYNIANGFNKRIVDFIAGGKAAIATGAVTAANAVTKFEQVYSEAMALYPGARGLKMNLYCSWGNFENYIDHYRTLFTFDPANFNDGPKTLYLKKSMGKVEIVPVDWLGTSERLILAPEQNMVMATDSLGDLSKINPIEDVYGLKYGITGTIDIQVPDSDLFFYNDQA